MQMTTYPSIVRSRGGVGWGGGREGGGKCYPQETFVRHQNCLSPMGDSLMRQQGPAPLKKAAQHDQLVLVHFRVAFVLCTFRWTFVPDCSCHRQSSSR